MAIHKILRVGDPLLRQVSKEIPKTEIQSKEIRKLIRDMLETMKEASGLGLAAPQIGVLKRIIVVGFDGSDRYPDLKEKIDYEVLINPKIEILKKEKLGFWEGCLSVPNMRGYVERPSRIKLSWLDENEEEQEKIVDNFPAIVYQHECDHLEGVLYIDHLKDFRLFGYCEELEKIKSI